MSKFYVPVRVPLNFISPEWSDCYLEFTSLSMDELINKVAPVSEMKNNVAEVASKMIEILEDCFVTGTGIDTNKEKIALTKEDIRHLPASVIGKVYQAFTEDTDPKA